MAGQEGVVSSPARSSHREESGWEASTQVPVLRELIARSNQAALRAPDFGEIDNRASDLHSVARRPDELRVSLKKPGNASVHMATPT